MDTMREFGRLGGTAYGILPDENSFMQDFAAEYQAQLSAAISRAPTLALTCLLYTSFLCFQIHLREQQETIRYV